VNTKRKITESIRIFYNKYPIAVYSIILLISGLVFALLFNNYVLGYGFSGALARLAVKILSTNAFVLVGIGLIMLALATLLNRALRKYIQANRFKIKWLVLAYLIVYFLAFTALSYYRHVNLQTAFFDFGLEQQVLWNTSNGNWFVSSPEVQNYLGDHFSPILVLPALVYRLFPGALTVFILQTLAVTFAIAGIYKLAKWHLQSDKWAVLIMLIFSVFGGVTGVLNFDYHPISFAMPLLVWGIYWYLRRPGSLLGISLLVLATLCKEDVGIFTGMFALSRLVFYRDRKAGVLAVYSFSIALLALFVIIPHFRNEPSDTLLRYAELGDSGGAIVKTLLTQPVFVWNYLAKSVHFSYLLKLFLPVAFLVVLAPKQAFILIPSLLVNLLANSPQQNSAMVHYDVMTSVGIFYATIWGLRNYLNYPNPKPKAESNLAFNWHRIILGFLLVGINLCFLGGNPAWKYLLETPNRMTDYQFIQNEQAQISPDAKLLVSNTLGGQFGHFANVQLYYPMWDLPRYQDADLIFIDNDRYDPVLQELIKQTMEQGYIIKSQTSGVVVLSRPSLTRPQTSDSIIS